MLFELLPYPMHIMITFLKPSKFYITSKNQRPVRSTSGKVGGARLRPFMVIALSKCKKKIRVRANIHLGGQTEFCPNGFSGGGGSSRNFPGSIFSGGDFQGSIFCGVADFLPLTAVTDPKFVFFSR